MLLRSISKHVKEQNWFAISLDLLIVIFGVFMGIQVSNWNQERVGERQAEVLLSRLYNDLQNDLNSLNAELAYLASVRKHAMIVLDALNGKKLISDNQFIISAYQASQLAGAWSTRTTYNEILSAGQFNLIKNQQLKDLIFANYVVDFTTQPIFSNQLPYREFIRGSTPISIQNAVNENCGDVTIEVAHSFAQSLPATCELQLPKVLVKKTAPLLRSNPKLLFNLRYQYSISNTQEMMLYLYVKQTERLMNKIKEIQS